jgi:hypothetical protein
MRGAVVLLVLGVVLALPQAALAQQRTVTAVGSSLNPVTPSDRTDNAAILAAIAAAKNAGIGPAMAAARTRAEQLAQAAGLTLGAVQGIEEGGGAGTFFFGGGPSELGTFGPGEFCGTVPRYVIRRGPGRRVRRVRRGTRRVCRFPNVIETRLAVTYAVS